MSDTTYHALQYHLSLGRLALQKARPKSALKWSQGALQLRDLSLSLDAIHEPQWIPVRPSLSGICGSDINLLRGQSSPYLSPLVSLPAVLGHEVVGTIDTDRAPWPRGTPVVIDPTLACSARNLPLCVACQRGEPDECANRQDPGFGPGLLLGYNRHLPGGWSTRMWAPSSQVIPIPPQLSLRRAVLAEPASIVWHGLARVNWNQISTILIIGAGTIGLLATWLCTTKAPHNFIAVRARHPYQARLATELGATEVYSSGDDRAFVADDALTPLAGPVLPSRFSSQPYRPEGFDLIIDTAGTQHSLYQALSLTRPGGQILLLGGAGRMSVEMTPIWSRRLTLYGSFGYSHHGSSSKAFRDTLHLLTETTAPLELLVTHTIPLDQYREAIALFRDRQTATVKVAFAP